MSIHNIAINKCKCKNNLYENSGFDVANFRCSQCFCEKLTQMFPQYVVYIIFIFDADSYQIVHLKFTVHFNSVSLVLID